MSLFGERFMLRSDLTQERAVEVLSSVAEPIRIDDRPYVVRVYGNRFYIQEENRGLLSGLAAAYSSRYQLSGAVKPISVNGEVKTDVGGTVVEGWISPPLRPLVSVITTVLITGLWSSWFLLIIWFLLQDGFDPDLLKLLLVALLPSVVALPLAVLLYRAYDRRFKAQVQIATQVLRALL
jgi:hypothetical protein